MNCIRMENSSQNKSKFSFFKRNSDEMLTPTKVSPTDQQCLSSYSIHSYVNDLILPFTSNLFSFWIVSYVSSIFRFNSSRHGWHYQQSRSNLTNFNFKYNFISLKYTFQILSLCSLDNIIILGPYTNIKLPWIETTS